MVCVRNVDPSVLTYRFRYTDTHMYVFPLPLTFSVVHNNDMGSLWQGIIESWHIKKKKLVFTVIGRSRLWRRERGDYRYYSPDKHTWIHQSHGFRHNVRLGSDNRYTCVHERLNTPVFMREYRGDGEGTDTQTLSLIGKFVFISSFENEGEYINRGVGVMRD